MRTKTELFIGAAIALGLLLNAAIGVVRIFHPEPAVAQTALTDVNLVQISGKPLDVYQWSDGTASPRVVLDTAIGGSEEYPLYVRTAPAAGAGEKTQ